MTEYDSIMEKLEAIESRLEKLENNGANKKIMIEERTEVEEEGKLGGSETSKENETLVKTKRIPVCDHCGEKLQESFAVCHKDGKKLCKKCSITFRGKIICPQDLRGILPISRPSFKILVLVGNSIDNFNVIHEISHIPKNDIKTLVLLLLEAGYIERSGFFGYKVTETGLEAIGAYGQLYGGENDMKELDEELKRFVLGQL